MPAVQIQQAKLEALAIAPQTTVGSLVPLSPGTAYRRIPVTDRTVEADQGTRIIDRSDVGDGYAGSAKGAIGSFGLGVQFMAELHSEPASVVPYIVWLLAACGHRCVGDSLAGNYVCTPTTVPIDAYPAAPTPYDTTIPPVGLSVVLGLADGDAGPVDAAMVAASVVGSHTLTMPAAGERVMFGFEGVGVLPGTAILTTGLTDIVQIGSPASTGRPAVFRGTSITVTSASGTYDLAEIRNVILTQGASVVATDRPQETWGFGHPSVYLDSAPTLAFELAATRGDLAKIFGDWIGGITLDVSLTLDLGGMTMQLDVPLAEVRSLARTETDGKRAITVECACVRPAASATAPYTYTITEAP